MVEFYEKEGCGIEGEKIRVEARKLKEKGKIRGSSQHRKQLMMAEKDAVAIIEKSYRSRYEDDGTHPNEHKLD